MNPSFLGQRQWLKGAERALAEDGIHVSNHTVSLCEHSPAGNAMR
jgi:hypothetical protein